MESIDLNCSFCLQPAVDVESLIAGPGIYICDQCVGLCQTILENKPSSRAPTPVTAWDDKSDEEMLAGLPKVAMVAAQVDQSLKSWVLELRDRSVTWGRIGEALGVTRQSAWGRFSEEP